MNSCNLLHERAKQVFYLGEMGNSCKKEDGLCGLYTKNKVLGNFYGMSKLLIQYLTII